MTDYLKKYKSLFSTTLASGIGTGTGDTLTLSSVTGLPTDTPITITVDRVDSEGNTTPTKLERITGTISGGNLTSYTRGVDGTTEQAHSAGAVVEMIFNAEDWNDVVDWGLIEHDQDGTHKSTLVTSLKSSAAEINTGTEDGKIVTPKGLKDSDVAYLSDLPTKATQAEIVAGTDDAKFATALAVAPFVNSSMARQAIINGNFDVWQRGTSIAMTAANAYTADRWYCVTATAGTDKTVSRQDGTGVNGSYYCARVAMVADVDELLTFSQALESQDSIKFRGKKVTLSFYARGGAEFVSDNATLVSKIVTGKGTDQKVLSFTTSADAISQNNTLTTSWVKFTCTTTNVIASDITQIGVSFSFTHAGSGTTTNYFEVTQVQLCAGDVALPFQPKSFEEELTACQRYYQKSYTYNTVPGTDVSAAGRGTEEFFTGTGTYNYGRGIFRPRLRAEPSALSYWTPAGTASKIRSVDDSTDVSPSGYGVCDTNFFFWGGATANKRMAFCWAVDAEL